MSFDAMRWAMEQPVEPALTKFCLLAMAECVNASEAEMLCWPSYAHLCRRTGMNTKTVEASVYRLKQHGYIVDTGRREGGTGKVIVYRLNTPAIGVVAASPTTPSANGTRPQNTPANGVITSGKGAGDIPPKTAPNPPKSDVISPQIVGVTTPKTGDGIRNGISKRTRKESGIEAACAALPDVPSEVLSDWLPIRKDKRAGPVTVSVAAALTREAAKAGLTPAAAVTYCCEAGWQNFNAKFYANREGLGSASGAGKNKQELLEDSNRAVAERWLEKQELPDVTH